MSCQGSEAEGLEKGQTLGPRWTCRLCPSKLCLCSFPFVSGDGTRGLTRRGSTTEPPPVPKMNQFRADPRNIHSHVHIHTCTHIISLTHVHTISYLLHIYTCVHNIRVHIILTHMYTHTPRHTSTPLGPPQRSPQAAVTGTSDGRCPGVSQKQRAARWYLQLSAQTHWASQWGARGPGRHSNSAGGPAVL